MEVENMEVENMEVENIRKFSQKSLEALGKAYVYGLIDPRTNKIFYVGKGTDNRVFAHEYESLKHPDSKKLKLNTIKEIKDAGYEIKKIIINFNMTENEAYAAEAALINVFNYLENTGLTNEVAGHHSKEAYTVDEFERLFGPEELTEDDIKHHLFAIKINKSYNRNMTKEEIYNSVRGSWKSRYPYKMDKLNKVQYVLAIYNDLIVGVYKPSMWSYLKDNVKDAPGEIDITEFSLEKGLGDRVYFRDYSFENGESMDEIQQYYIYKSVSQIKKLDRVRSSTYLDPK